VDLVERSALSAPRHPWEIARATFFTRLLSRKHLLDAPTWLDVGAGDAWFARQLLEHLPAPAAVTAWDAFYTPEDLARPRADRIHLVADRPNTRFDRILLMDVVEHVEDDRAFLRGVVDQNLEENGWVLITVPAYQSLFSRHDTHLRHYRRYSPRACRSLIAECGLAVREEGGLFHSLLAARAAAVAIERLSTRGAEKRGAGQSGIGAWNHSVGLTRAVLTGLRAEGRISAAAARRGWKVPGLTYWALCTRRT
jgi:SAM-dependent methyltransferase